MPPSRRYPRPDGAVRLLGMLLVAGDDSAEPLEGDTILQGAQPKPGLFMHVPKGRGIEVYPCMHVVGVRAFRRELLKIS